MTCVWFEWACTGSQWHGVSGMLALGASTVGPTVFDHSSAQVQCCQCLIILVDKRDRGLKGQGRGGVLVARTASSSSAACTTLGYRHVTEMGVGKQVVYAVIGMGQHLW
jgi:hypothetical protein